MTTRPASGPFKGQQHRLNVQRERSTVAVAAWVQAEGMMQDAHLDDDATVTNALANDIMAVGIELDTTADAVGMAIAARELTRRIGGLENLDSYAATLLAGLGAGRGTAKQPELDVHAYLVEHGLGDVESRYIAECVKQRPKLTAYLEAQTGRVERDRARISTMQARIGTLVDQRMDDQERIDELTALLRLVSIESVPVGDGCYSSLESSILNRVRAALKGA